MNNYSFIVFQLQIHFKKNKNINYKNKKFIIEINKYFYFL